MNGPEEDLQDWLRSVAASLGTEEASLTLYPEDGDADAPLELVATGAATPADVHLRLASLLRVAPSGAHRWQPASGDPEWSSCMVEERLWHVLHMSVWSRRAHSKVLVNFLFRSDSFADRSRILAELQARRPMIEAYLRLWQRMRAKSRSSEGLRCALDSVEIGVLLIDRLARIAFANRSATAFLAAGDPLRQNGDSFTAIDLRQAVPLQVALSHALAANADFASSQSLRRSAPILSLRCQRSDRSIVLTVVPAETRATEHHDVAAVVYMVDPSLDKASQLRPVCALFGLSPVETRLVCLLTNGRTLQEAAEAMRIKDQTARTYLKQIFLKTDTKRQADLVRLMLSSLLGVEKTIEPATFQLA
jgi:DNA-binding CsgD family transcriptional regulator/PAS domain-containing protein